MKRFLIATTIAFAGVSVTYAGNSNSRNPEATNSWSGFYAGINGGYSRSSNDGALYAFFPSEPTPLRPTSATLNLNGGFGGFQVGYIRQLNGYVFGIEADIQGASIASSGYGTTPFVILKETITGKLNVDSFGTLRGRLGYGFRDTLVYATSGVAAGQVNFAFSYANATEFGALSQRSVLAGWVVGGGIEQKISTNWSVKAEYQRIDLGSIRVTGGVPVTCNVAPCPLTSSQNVNFHTGRLGLNYQFGPR